MNRREFLELLAAAAAGGGLGGCDQRQPLGAASAASLYDVPPFGDVSLLHFTDCHAQLRPVYYREPSLNLGIGNQRDKPPHLVGEALRKHYRLAAGSPELHAFTHLDFVEAAHQFGKVGGFAHLATLIKNLRATRPNRTLLLDGGDSWQGSATSLWTRGADMIGACKLLGVDAMTGHWEFAYGAARVQEAVEQELRGKIDFLAHNVLDAAAGNNPVFPTHLWREIGGVPVAIIGQAHPFTPLAHPREGVEPWTFGINEPALQALVDQLRNKGAQVVALLSHNGVDVDLKLAARVSGIDVILGGHTHDAMPAPAVVANPGGKTLVIQSGSHTKFLSVLDLRVKRGRVRDFRYRLLPVFADLIAPDREMNAYIDKVRAPYRTKLEEKLAVTESLLYRRGTFNGSVDELILQALLTTYDAPIAVTPGFRWGPTLLPGEPITTEHVMDLTAITYPGVAVNEFTGARIKDLLEDAADTVFHPDPYYRQGGDMLRSAGLRYTLDLTQEHGNRIQNLAFGDEPLASDKTYKVAGWGGTPPPPAGAKPIWDVVTQYLRASKVVRTSTPYTPDLKGADLPAGG
jgi:sulfur-oxidizing protein SoxB